jgi:hypothetical protein
MLPRAVRLVFFHLRAARRNSVTLSERKLVWAPRTRLNRDATALAGELPRSKYLQLEESSFCPFLPFHTALIGSHRCVVPIHADCPSWPTLTFENYARYVFIDKLPLAGCLSEVFPRVPQVILHLKCKPHLRVGAQHFRQTQCHVWRNSVLTVEQARHRDPVHTNPRRERRHVSRAHMLPKHRTWMWRTIHCGRFFLLMNASVVCNVTGVKNALSW